MLARQKIKHEKEMLEPADEHDMEEMESAVDEKAVRIPQDLNYVPKLKKK
jgi:hypothetical protein